MAEIREMVDKTKPFQALGGEAIPEDVKDMNALFHQKPDNLNYHEYKRLIHDELRARLIKTIGNALAKASEPQMVHVTCPFLTASQRML